MNRKNVEFLNYLVAVLSPLNGRDEKDNERTSAEGPSSLDLPKRANDFTLKGALKS